MSFIYNWCQVWGKHTSTNIEIWPTVLSDLVNMDDSVGVRFWNDFDVFLQEIHLNLWTLAKWIDEIWWPFPLTILVW